MVVFVDFDEETLTEDNVDVVNEIDSLYGNITSQAFVKVCDKYMSH